MRHTPKKRLGQNFLRDGHVRRRMVDACGFSRADTVLEIGPGQGALTPLIAERVKKLYAVELDRGLAAELAERYAGSNISVINADILGFDLSSIAAADCSRIKVFGNIPYYITSPIIEHLVGFRCLIDVIFLTVQKEFARRICAGPGSKEYGSFSCFVQYYMRPSILFDVKKNSFYPAPKVDSSFIRLDVRQKPAVAVSDEERLFAVIRAAFGQRRKTVRNSLKEVFPDGELEKALARCGIDPLSRPEDLALGDFAALADPSARC